MNWRKAGIVPKSPFNARSPAWPVQNSTNGKTKSLFAATRPRLIMRLRLGGDKTAGSKISSTFANKSETLHASNSR